MESGCKLENMRFFVVAPTITGRSGLLVSTSDCSVRRPRFESNCGQLCLSDGHCNIQPWAWAATFNAVPRLTQISTLHGWYEYQFMGSVIISMVMVDVDSSSNF